MKKNLMKVNGEDVILKEFINNSAPCSHCIFLERKPKRLKCTFPKGKKKRCCQTSGTHNGWNTMEYVYK